MTRKAFTLIELVVSLGILAVILSFAGVIFRVSVESQRMAVANADVMRTLRIITEQLDADFRGGAIPTRLPYGYPVHISYDTRTPAAGGGSPGYSDAVVLFTSGDFRSTEQYGGKTIAGNVACVFYGQPDPNSYKRTPRPYEKLLLRRQTILTAGAPASGSNARGEYFQETAQEWLVTPPFADVNDWTRRPVVEPNNVKANLSMFVAQGVDNFTVEYIDATTVLGTSKIDWQRSSGRSGSGVFNPRAFKFTFTLYDSRGIIKKGRTFTHIVVWDS